MPTFAQMQAQRMDEQQAQRDAAQAQRQEVIRRDLAARMAELTVTDDRITREKAALAEQHAQGARDLARQAADARETELRVRFDARFPGGSDGDFQVLRPQLLTELGAETEATIAGMRARYRSMV